MIRGQSGMGLFAVTISLLWRMIFVLSYLGLTGEIKVAYIQAMLINNVAHQIGVLVMLFHGNGHVTSGTI